MIDQLTTVGDADEFVGSGCHDFFTGEGCASSLDHAAGFINLVSAIDIDVKLWRRVEIHDSNAMGGESPLCFLAGCNSGVEGVFDLSQFINEVIGS